MDMLVDIDMDMDNYVNYILIWKSGDAEWAQTIKLHSILQRMYCAKSIMDNWIQQMIPADKSYALC